MARILITGATGGLGFQTTRALAKDASNHVTIAVRNVDRGQEVARALGPNVTVSKLDMSSLKDVVAFAGSLDGEFDAIINNAGVQFAHREVFSDEGIEQTFLVNHLAAFALTVAMLPQLSGARVVFIGSGTHNPEHRVPRAFGFRGAQFTDIPSAARGGDHDGPTAQRNMDRYATSKFLNTVTAVELARRYPASRFYTFDPGLMPGTGLARDVGPVQQFAWKYIMPLAAPFLPDTSSVRRSGASLAWTAVSPKNTYPSGAVLDYKRKLNKFVWEEKVLDPTIGARVYEESMDLVRATVGAHGVSS